MLRGSNLANGQVMFSLLIQPPPAATLTINLMTLQQRKDL